jgi:hypothetical protein
MTPDLTLGTELDALRLSLPKRTSTNVLAKRLGYSRQWVRYQELRSEPVSEAFATEYRRLIEKLRAEQAGEADLRIDVGLSEIIRPGMTYGEALAAAREWLRAHPTTAVAIEGTEEDDRQIVAIVDAFDRAGVDVVFRAGGLVRRSKP